MVEQRVSRTRIDDYFRRWQEMSPDTFMTYLYVDEPDSHFHSIMRERGEAWTSKLIAWVVSTPFGKTQNLHGEAGFVEFWARYRTSVLSYWKHRTSSFVSPKPGHWMRMASNKWWGREC